MNPPPFESFGNALRERRRQLGLTQAELARQLGMSRQNLVEIESGRRLPQLLSARHIASVLGWTVDELTRRLTTDAGGEIRWVLDEPPSTKLPVVWTLLSHNIAVAQAGRVAPDFVFDGYWDPDKRRVDEIAGCRDPGTTLFVAGCDPFLPWLWERTPHPDVRLYVFSMGSRAALQALAQGQVHVAGTHLYDPVSHQYNRIVDSLPVTALRWQYLQWDTGLIGSLRDPAGWVLRERGSEARALFDRVHEVSEETESALELDSHWAVARYVRAHPGLAGVGIRAVAEALNLPFYRLAQEPYEWVTQRQWLDDWRIRSFENWLQSPAVCAALEQIPGITPWSPGRVTDSP